MIYRSRFRVSAPIERVEKFHRRPANLAAVTPPFVPMRFLIPPPERLQAGDELTMRMWVGPIPVTWWLRVATLDEPEVVGFRDRQISGPFAYWEHRHRFRPAADGSATWIEDEIEARWGGGLMRRLIGWQMWAGLPVLFAYRRRRTRKLLE
ncbi:MAG: SRPBCC family protein [Acidobacteriota bacterium]